MDNNMNEKNLPEQTEELAEEVVEEVAEGISEAVEEAVETAEDTVVEAVEDIDEAVEEVETVKETAEKLPAAPSKGRKGKLIRGGQATLMTVIFVAIVVVVNILVGALTERFPSMNVDLTANKMNTLSDQAVEIAKGVEKDTTIYLIGAEEKYRKDQIYSSMGLKFSQVANLAEKLHEVNPRITMKFIDPDENPAFISDFTEENLYTGCTLVQTEKRYRVLGPVDLFSVTQNSQTYATETFSKVDSALAGAIEMVNKDTVPVITVATGNEEMLSVSDSLSAFVTMMENQNFEVREINILSEDIPEETQIVMIPTPTKDYTTEEVDKLRAFLDGGDGSSQRMLLVTCHATQPDLPKFSAFLEEWGISVGKGVIFETSPSRTVAGYANYVLVDANQEELLKNESYNILVAPSCRPVNLLFEGNIEISTMPLWKTADSAYIVEDATNLEENPVTGEQVAAAIAARYMSESNKSRRSVVVFGTSFVFTNNYINATAYSDANYIRDLLRYCTDTDGSSVTVKTQSVQTHVLDISAPAGTVNFLGIGVFAIGLPALILVIGLVIFLRRRHM